jgi:hypothetical protein
VALLGRGPKQNADQCVIDDLRETLRDHLVEVHVAERPPSVR